MGRTSGTLGPKRVITATAASGIYGLGEIHRERIAGNFSSAVSVEYLVVAGGGGCGGYNQGQSAGGTGGGGAGRHTDDVNAIAGTVNTGSGGGGGPNAGGTSGAGGAGFVCIRYADTFDLATSTTGSPIITPSSGGYRIYEWTGSGSITF